MFKIKPNFIGCFKTGDNINHNLKVLALLYYYFDKAEVDEKRLLCKPIILIIVSIIEAVLHDFHGRIIGFTKEGVSSVASEVIDYIRGIKHNDQLEKYIASAKKYDFFGMKDTKLYDRLDDLRKLRNRIHIQNTRNYFEVDEYEAFNDNLKIMAEKVLEIVLRVMENKHSRGFTYVQDFELPWKEYYIVDKEDSQI